MVSTKVIYCDPKLNITNCDIHHSMFSRYTIYHTVVKSEYGYKHFIWLFYTSPMILITDTSENCELIVDFNMFLSQDPINSIYFKVNESVCKPLFGYVQLVFNDIQELVNLKLVKSYKLSDLFDKVNHTLDSTQFSTELSYNKGTIKFTFTTNDDTSTEKSLPYLALTPHNNLINLIISNLSTNSSSSTFQLTFQIFSSMTVNFNSSKFNIFIDSLGFGIFRSYEIYSNPQAPSNSKSVKEKSARFSFFWKDVAYAEKIKKKSAMLSASLLNFTSCNAVLNPAIMYKINHTTGYCGNIVFEAVNTENAFKEKSYIVWECTVGHGNSYIQFLNIITIVLITLAYSIPLFISAAIAVILVIKLKKKNRDYERLESNDSLTDEFI